MAALAVIDHFGRRRLMLVGSIGYIVSLGATAWAFYRYGTEFTAAGSRGRAARACWSSSPRTPSARGR